MPQQRSVFAERISQGLYINVVVDREEAARYGLSVADVQSSVSSGIGGKILQRISKEESAIRSMYVTSRTFATVLIECAAF